MKYCRFTRSDVVACFRGFPLFTWRDYVWNTLSKRGFKEDLPLTKLKYCDSIVYCQED